MYQPTGCTDHRRGDRCAGRPDQPDLRPSEVHRADVLRAPAPQLVLRDASAGRSDEDKDKANPDQIKWMLIGNGRGSGLGRPADLRRRPGRSGLLRCTHAIQGQDAGRPRPAPPGRRRPGPITAVATDRAEVLWIGGTHLRGVRHRSDRALDGADHRGVPTVTQPRPGLQPAGAEALDPGGERQFRRASSCSTRTPAPPGGPVPVTRRRRAAASIRSAPASCSRADTDGGVPVSAAAAAQRQLSTGSARPASCRPRPARLRRCRPARPADRPCCWSPATPAARRTSGRSSTRSPRPVSTSPRSTCPASSSRPGRSSLAGYTPDALGAVVRDDRRRPRAGTCTWSGTRSAVWSRARQSSPTGPCSPTWC